MMIKFLPSLLTLTNVLSGTIGIIEVFDDRIDLALLWMGVGLVADFLDGFVARLVDASSDFGKELDSLADVITFGVLPSMAMYTLLSSLHPYLGYSALLLPVFSAARLAKFNIDEEQTYYFKGTPTPITAIGIMCLVYAISSGSLSSMFTFLKNPWVLAVNNVIFSVLLVIPIPLVSNKFKDKTFRSNWLKIAIVLSAVTFIFAFGWIGGWLTLCTYVLLSILFFRK